MAQQTAVEWLIDRLLDGSLRFEETKMGFLISMKNGDEIEQAKAMEKEQIINAYNWAAYEQASNRELDLSAAEVYYNKKYKQ